MKTTIIVAIILSVVMVVLSGCIGSSHHPEVPMRKIIEYPVVMITANDIVLIMFEGGEATMKFRGEMSEVMHWELKTGETDFYHYRITGTMLVSYYNLGDPDAQIPCRDLVLRKDGTASFGSVKDDVFFDGHWH